MESDRALLNAYCRDASQEAFAELVRRYAPLVHGVCLRQCRDAVLAEDMTQAVFMVLSQKAHTLSGEPVLSAWLFRVARYACANANRKEARRRRHEAAAASQRADRVDPVSDAVAWEHVSPALDESIASLRRPDRHAILMRFFERRMYREIAAAMGSTEDAVRMRIDRALRRLRDRLVKRGVESTLGCGALAALLADHAVAAPPALLETTCLASAGMASQGVSASAGPQLAYEGVTKMMYLAKVKVFSYAAAGLVAVATMGLYGPRLVSAEPVPQAEPAVQAQPSAAAPLRDSTQPAPPEGKGWHLSPPIIKQVEAVEHYWHIKTRVSLTTIADSVEQILSRADEAMDDGQMVLRGGPVFVYHGVTGEPNKPFDLRVGFPLKHDPKEDGPDGFETRMLEEYTCVSYYYTGPVDQLPQVYRQVMPQVYRAGHRPTGETREVYLHWVAPDSPNNVVEIQVGITPPEPKI